MSECPVRQSALYLTARPIIMSFYNAITNKKKTKYFDMALGSIFLTIKTYMATFHMIKNKNLNIWSCILKI